MNKKIFKLIFEGIVFLFCLIWMILNFATHNQYQTYIVSIILFVLSTLLVFYFEIDYFRVYKQLKNFNFNMDFLIAFATHITYLVSLIFSIIKICQNSIYSLSMEFWEVGFSLSFFIGVGKIIEDSIKKKTSLGIKDLLKLQQKKALVLDNKTNEFILVNHNQIKKGEIIKVLKGESVPTDGILVSNFSSFDCSSLLGESVPRTIKKGEQLLSGMINLNDQIIYKTTKTSNDSTLNKIVLQLEMILKNKSKIERVSEKIVKWFLPIVVFISLITFITWLILSYLGISLNFAIMHLENFDLSNPWLVATYHAVAVLVISCPCTFGIAAPAAIYSSSGIAAKNKILFSSAKIYEAINKIDYIAFDKTGTLTNGAIDVIKQNGSKKFNDYIYQMSFNSTHPLSKAISRYVKKTKNINFRKYEEKAGIGIFADKYFLGSLDYAIKNNYQFNIKIEEQDKNSLIVLFAKNKIVESYFVLKDKIKKDTKEIINKLKNMSIKPIILSGDRIEVVKDVANQLEISEYYGNLLPFDKAKIIKKYNNIIFVGDGINDILAIKEASIGMAFSSGSEISNSQADISLLEPKLSLVYKTILLAKRTLKLVKTNFIWGSLFNFICIPLAIIGLIPAWLGVVLMTMSTVVLLTNTLIARKQNLKMLSEIN